MTKAELDTLLSQSSDETLSRMLSIHGLKDATKATLFYKTLGGKAFLTMVGIALALEKFALEERQYFFLQQALRAEHLLQLILGTSQSVLDSEDFAAYDAEDEEEEYSIENELGRWMLHAEALSQQIETLTHQIEQYDQTIAEHEHAISQHHAAIDTVHQQHDSRVFAINQRYQALNAARERLQQQHDVLGPQSHETMQDALLQLQQAEAATSARLAELAPRVDEAGLEEFRMLLDQHLLIKTQIHHLQALMEIHQPQTTFHDENGEKINTFTALHQAKYHVQAGHILAKDAAGNMLLLNPGQELATMNDVDVEQARQAFKRNETNLTSRAEQAIQKLKHQANDLEQTRQMEIRGSEDQRDKQINHHRNQIKQLDSMKNMAQQGKAQAILLKQQCEVSLTQAQAQITQLQSAAPLNSAGAQQLPTPATIFNSKINRALQLLASTPTNARVGSAARIQKTLNILVPHHMVNNLQPQAHNAKKDLEAYLEKIQQGKPVTSQEQQQARKNADLLKKDVARLTEKHRPEQQPAPSPTPQPSFAPTPKPRGPRGTNTK